jgi:hypothetical protein
MIMMKRTAFILLAGTFLFGCGPRTEQQASQEEKAESFKISEIAYAPLEFEDKIVQFEGVIGHMCQHAGDKMRVHQIDDATYSIQVMLKELKPEFNTSMEGQVIRITGKIQNVILNQAELEARMDADHDHGDHDDDEDHDDHDCSSTIVALERMKARGIDPRVRPDAHLISYELL